jgi:hypothetical protein
VTAHRPAGGSKRPAVLIENLPADTLDRGLRKSLFAGDVLDISPV